MTRHTRAGARPGEGALGRWLTAGVMAMLLHCPVRVLAQETVVHYHTDAVGSVRMITDEAGSVVARYDYLPFGEPWGPPPPGTNARQFAGKENDRETGLDYFGGRYYASGNGRFTTVDPMLDVEQGLVDPQRWNRYAYARNNPLRYVDPDGRAIETAWDVLNLGAGLASLGANLAAGNLPGAALDLAGVLVDAGATSIPGVPGGASSAIKAARLAENARLGRLFEGAVLDALGAAKNTGGVSEIATRVTTIPDLLIGKFFGVTDIKNVQNLSFTKQLQAQFAAAQTAGLPFNLIVASRTEHISERVRRVIESTNGKIFIYDEKMKKFSEAAFDEYGNLIP